jgi:hypothetical protein
MGKLIKRIASLFGECFKFSMSTFKQVVILMFLLVSLPLALNAQDVLKLKSGRELKVTVIEETNDIVKYVEYENQSGPVFSVQKDKIESIKYKKGAPEKQASAAPAAKPAETAKENGASQGAVSQLLSVKKRYIYLNGVVQGTRSLKTLMDDYPEAVKNYEKGKTMLNLSTTCALAVTITSFTFSSIVNKQKLSADKIRIGSIGLAIDGGFIITAIVLSAQGKKEYRKAVTIYNNGITKPVTLNVSFGVQENGLGVGIRF